MERRLGRGENLSGEYLKRDSPTSMSEFLTPSCSSDDFQETPIEKRIENFERLHENVQNQKELIFKQFHELSAKRKAYVAAKRRSHISSNRGIFCIHQLWNYSHHVYIHSDKYKDVVGLSQSFSNDSISEDFTESRDRSSSSASSDGLFILDEVANEQDENIRFSAYVKYLFTKKFWKPKR